MLKLEYFERSDFGQLIEWVKDETLLMNWSGALFSFPLTEKSLEWYIDEVNDATDSDAFIFKAVETTTEKVVGHISLGSISKKNRSARISRVLVGGTGNNGKGYCQAMVKAVLKIGFAELNLHRISLGVYDFNIAAIKCYQKCGFITEGITRDVLFFKEKWWSLIEMSILEDEWMLISGNLTP